MVMLLGIVTIGLCILDIVLIRYIQALMDDIELFKRICRINFNLLENSVEQLIKKVYGEETDDVHGGN